MKRLIVTADDFGLTEKVNQAIVECHRVGIVTSTSLMANGGGFEGAVALSRETPTLGIGAHLNLTEGIPVARAETVSSLLNSEGRFRYGPGSLGRAIAAGRVRLPEIELELRAQIEKILGAGVRLTHFDGHKHVQLLPKVFGIALRLGAKYGVKGIRCAVEPIREPISLWQRTRNAGNGYLKQFVVGRGLSMLALKLRRSAKDAGMQTPRHFFGIAQTGFLDIEALSNILNTLPEGASELMCHPGYVDEALSRTPTRLLQQRESEVRALTDLQIRQLVTANSIKLITYSELNETS